LKTCRHAMIRIGIVGVGFMGIIEDAGAVARAECEVRRTDPI
jgi:hypothetical protein